MKTKWFKVSEKLPEDTDVVLMWHDCYIAGNAAVGFYDHGKWHLFHTSAIDKHIRVAPTHWRYLPKPPTE